MKSFLLLISCSMLLTLVACGKKANEKDSKPESLGKPSYGELYFNALKEVEMSVNNNDLKTLKKVLVQNPNLNLDYILNDGETLLIKAIKKNFTDIRNFLLERNCNVEQESVQQETPLMAAVAGNHINSVRILLDRNVGLNKKNSTGDTALHIALKKGHEEIALILIKQGANLEITDQNDKNPYKLAQDADLNSASELIRSIMQVEFGAPDLASFRSVLVQGDYKTLQTILSRYPTVALDYESINPLLLLIDSKNENVAMLNTELLIRHHANVNGAKDAPVTPLIHATMMGKENFVYLLLNARANPQLLDQEGKSALIHAIDLNNLSIVEMLLSHSASERYTIRKNGQRVSFNACNIAKKIGKKLKTAQEKFINKEIQNALDCGFLSWLF